MKNNNINVNPITKTIEVSKAFLKKAKVYGSPEYLALKEVRAAEPTFAIKEREIKKSGSKKTYSNLTFKAMEAHINFTIADESERKEALNEFEAMKAYGEARGSKYPVVKKWFLNKYADSYNVPINEEENAAA